MEINNSNITVIVKYTDIGSIQFSQIELITDLKKHKENFKKEYLKFYDVKNLSGDANTPNFEYAYKSETESTFNEVIENFKIGNLHQLLDLNFNDGFYTKEQFKNIENCFIFCGENLRDKFRSWLHGDRTVNSVQSELEGRLEKFQV